ncbi:hypothetical protein HYH02_013704 [Chlamydomonas schloesseri]|uniref:Uncharacterized protein n=1 Tax=Chlamydomonas schloesseri TaxID=2026947 RepID=A0A835VYN1_9CHLO|nr:hypothetical protein HYH02_013704 [Chlamydomonas schloesseri]|eukprot:KAG2430708.1 hypothetical protein HYH02_013704 [Chlamydomonas schloesseri]
MIDSLATFLVPKPRAFHIVASRSCDRFENFGSGSKVRCYLEDSLVRNLTSAAVKGWLHERFSGRSAADLARVLDRGTWFFQQFLKLAVAQYLPDLAPHFIIFDSDMIALHPLTWFLPLNADPARITGAAGVTPPLNVSLSTGQPLPPMYPPGGAAGATPAGDATSAAAAARRANCTNPHPFLTLIHVGGWKPHAGYQHTYQRLTGRPIIHSPGDGSSLVAHHTLVYRPHMAHFLAAITSPQHAGAHLGWALSVMDAVAALKEVGEVHVGFPEYWSYLSWVQDNYPCTVAFAKRRDKLLVDRLVPICCPTARNLEATARGGWLFTGYELGHHDHCIYHHPVFAQGYADWFLD